MTDPELLHWLQHLVSIIGEWLTYTFAIAVAAFGMATWALIKIGRMRKP